MLINELSKRSQVSIHTIRYYENLGLLQGRINTAVTSNNYKDYDEEALERLHIIKDAKEVGFTLSEIRQLLTSWYDPHTSRAEQVTLFTLKMAEIDSRIQQLKQVKKRLEKVVKELENGEC